MALFGKKKEEGRAKAEDKASGKAASVKTEEVSGSQANKAVVSPELIAEKNVSSVIIKPRITEKAALSIDRNVYTFIVRRDATKYSVLEAIKSVYNVTPVKIHIVNKKPRHYTSRARGRRMLEKGMKKAYVYLKEGDRIDLV